MNAILKKQNQSGDAENELPIIYVNFIRSSLLSDDWRPSSEGPGIFAILVDDESKVGDSYDEENEITVCKSVDLGSLARLVGSRVDIDLYKKWLPVLDESLLVDQSFSEETLTFFQQVGSVFNSKILNKNTINTLGNDFLENSLLNAPLSYASNSLGVLKAQYDGRPVMIMAGGPSLDKQLETIKQHQKYFCIVVVASVYNACLNHDIKPDFIMVSDTLNYPIWPSNPESIVIMDVGCDPVAAWKAPQKTVFMSHRPDISSFLKSLNISCDYLLSGGSVANTAYSFAKHIGAKSIVLVGQDLAFSEDQDHSKHHTDPYDERMRRVRAAMGFKVKGYYGSTVLTERPYLMFKEWFESQIRENPEILVFNCTEGGAFIDGANHLPLNVVCNELAPLKINSKSSYTLQPSELACHNQLKAKIQEIWADLRELKKIINKVVNLKINNQITDDKIKQIDKCLHAISNSSLEFKFFVNAVGPKELHEVTKEIKLANPDDLTKVYLLYQKVAKSYSVSLNKLDELFDNTMGFYNVFPKKSAVSHLQLAESYELISEVISRSHIDRKYAEYFEQDFQDAKAFI